MEYGLRLEAPDALPDDPRAGAPPELSARLPAGPLVALYFGSEFCQERLPGVSEAERFCRLAGDGGLEAALLTPPVTSRGLEQVRALLEALEVRGFEPAVVFNDWGVLGLLEERFPHLPRRAGRLLNRALRDPRSAEQRADATPERRNRRLRALLASRGVVALETDPDLEGGYLGPPGAGFERALHLPYSFVTSGRVCLLRDARGRERPGGLTGELGAPCGGACRRGARRVVRSDTRVPLWRAGNTLFCRTPGERVDRDLAEADRVVLHRRPSP